MKILLISKWVAGATPGDFFYPGVWRDTFELALALNKAGHEVAILTPRIFQKHQRRFKREFSGTLTKYDIPHYQSPTYVAFSDDWGIFRWKMFFSEVKTIFMFKPEIIQYMEFSPTLLYPFIGKRKVFFYSCYFKTQYPDENKDRLAKQKDWGQKKSFLNIFFNLSYLFINKAIGSMDVKKIHRRGGVLILMHKEGYELIKKILKSNKNVYFIQKGIQQQSLVQPSLHSKNTILFIGSILYGKGIFDLLKAFKEIKTRIPAVELLIAGSGPKILVRKLRTTIKKLKATYVGSVNYNNKWNLYKKSSVFCLPSYRDAYPSVILEAQIAGLPIITSYEIDSPVVEKKTGLKIHCGDIKKLGKALIKVMSDAPLRKNMGRASFNNSRNYTLKKSAQELVKLYNSYKVG